MNHKRYETMRKNAHDLYRQGDLPQKLAVSIMGTVRLNAGLSRSSIPWLLGA